MTHPFTDIAAAAAVVAAVGAGTVLVLPRPKPEPSVVVLDITDPGVVIAEPQPDKSDVERVAELERQVSSIGAEQKALAENLRAAIEARLARKNGREGRARDDLR